MRNSLLFKLIFWISFIIIWYLMGTIINSNLILPPPHKVLYKFLDLFKHKDFYSHLFITFIRSTLGLFIALFSGFLLGYIKNKFFYSTIRNIIDIFQSNPLIVWITIALFWFGFGNKTIIFTVFIVLFPNFYLVTYNAINNIPKEYLELFKIYPISRKNYLIKFLIPYLKPFILPNLANSTISSLKITAMAEFLSGESGIGFLLSYAKAFLNIEEVYAYAVILFILSKILELIFIKSGILKGDKNYGFSEG
ncbi:MAG: ABC transporter permease [Dictyoglomus sp.]|uniref:ABC transporter permease n=1 Tax=Dictyoglomus sp. TaxID=28205 RepID=UPI003D0FA80E